LGGDMKKIKQRKFPIFIGKEAFWLCPKCKTLLSEECFYKSKKTTNGLSSQCKKCHIDGCRKTRDKDNHRRLNREYMRRWRDANIEMSRNIDRDRSAKRIKDIKYFARYRLNLAVKRGDVSKPIYCQKCGEETNLHGHHIDYYMPLNVVWLCNKCHGVVHRYDYVENMKVSMFINNADADKEKERSDENRNNTD
jgi:hypothetical protein